MRFGEQEIRALSSALVAASDNNGAHQPATADPSACLRASSGPPQVMQMLPQNRAQLAAVAASVAALEAGLQSLVDAARSGEIGAEIRDVLQQHALHVVDEVSSVVRRLKSVDEGVKQMLLP